MITGWIVETDCAERYVPEIGDAALLMKTCNRNVVYKDDLLWNRAFLRYVR